VVAGPLATNFAFVVEVLEDAHESAARGLSRYGYANLILEQVASEAGYTRGALYHQFKNKEDLALAVIAWVDETWRQEVGRLIDQESDPVAALIVMARGHAVYCRRDIARVAIALRLEFSGQDHPVGRHLERVSESLVKRCTRLISAGRRAGTIPAGPPARVIALAFIGALEGTIIQLAGKAPHDEVLAPRAAAGVLGLNCVPTATQEAALSGRRNRQACFCWRPRTYKASSSSATECRTYADDWTRRPTRALTASDDAPWQPPQT